MLQCGIMTSGFESDSVLQVMSTISGQNFVNQY